jgi:hypothetical protein
MGKPIAARPFRSSSIRFASDSLSVRVLSRIGPPVHVVFQREDIAAAIETWRHALFYPLLPDAGFPTPVYICCGLILAHRYASFLECRFAAAFLYRESVGSVSLLPISYTFHLRGPPMVDPAVRKEVQDYARTREMILGLLPRETFIAKP